MNSIERVPVSRVASAARLSVREQQVFSFLQTGGEWTIDQLDEKLGWASKSLTAKKAITQVIKMMAYKINSCGYKITMVGGGRGRGKKGVYKLERIK